MWDSSNPFYSFHSDAELCTRVAAVNPSPAEKQSSMKKRLTIFTRMNWKMVGNTPKKESKKNQTAKQRLAILSWGDCPSCFSVQLDIAGSMMPNLIHLPLSVSDRCFSEQVGLARSMWHGSSLLGCRKDEIDSFGINGMKMNEGNKICKPIYGQKRSFVSVFWGWLKGKTHGKNIA